MKQFFCKIVREFRNKLFIQFLTNLATPPTKKHCSEGTQGFYPRRGF